MTKFIFYFLLPAIVLAIIYNVWLSLSGRTPSSKNRIAKWAKDQDSTICLLERRYLFKGPFSFDRTARSVYYVSIAARDGTTRSAILSLRDPAIEGRSIDVHWTTQR